MGKKILVSFAIFLNGCLGYKPFQPPPSGSEIWKKEGASEAMVTLALLECGSREPRGRVPGLQETETVNDDVLTRLCMEKSGFTSDSQYSAANFCQMLGNKPTACNPGIVPPTRDVSRRLNSQFCKAFPDADVCH
ncbi:hypothetical protein ISP15_17655 [Dyella jejuensis]|uniref:Lipoprotein n=1 Tax=Dyella jejuensis TaxID=1432009 RepID=A0ABW8JM15_9GAMM